MHWPADHPMCVDERLARHRGAADRFLDEALPDARVVRTLRHLAGRRVVTLVHHGDRLVVCKVFGSPRARGNHRRLGALHASVARDVVPGSTSVDETGHVWLIDHVPGVVLDDCDDDRFVAAAVHVGRALRTLHDSGALLDRRWTIDEELAQLQRRAPERTADLVAAACARIASQNAGRGALVSSHRDCHPKQVVLDPLGRARWIDLDDAAMAPAGLDVGNVVAHLRRDAVLGMRPAAVVATAIDGVLDGYGAAPAELDLWVELSTLRLAGLATTRHARPEWTERLCAVVAR